MMDNFIRLPVTLDDIVVGDDRRLPQADKLSEITDSIKRIGLLNPISVQMVDDKPILIAGLHRLLGLKALGETETVAHVFSDLSEIDAELIEIDENLARAELTALERSEQVARRIHLTIDRQLAEPAEQQHADQQEGISRQVDAKPGRPKGGVRAAARKSNIPEAEARRSIKVAELSPSAKLVAQGLGLDKSKRALLDAAKYDTPEKQIATLREAHHQKQVRAEYRRDEAECKRLYKNVLDAEVAASAPNDPAADVDAVGAVNNDDVVIDDDAPLRLPDERERQRIYDGAPEKVRSVVDAFLSLKRKERDTAWQLINLYDQLGGRPAISSKAA